MHSAEAVSFETRTRFPTWAPDGFVVTPIDKGGSGRKFYRVESPDGESMITIKYTPQRPENLRYVAIAERLAAAGVPVPTIYLHDAEEGLIWMQDLGKHDLWSEREQSVEARRNAYRLALDAITTLHVGATEAFRKDPLALEIEFNQQLYLWEQGYFFEHCLGGIFKLPESEIRRLAALPELSKMAESLAVEKRVLVHRDFQSQNVMLHRGKAWLIDFQGMRPGLPHYDLASLLYDPYVDLTASDRDVLLADYKMRVIASGGEIPPSFDTLFARCAVQRLMQALGAYGFLGLQCGKPEFLDSVPAARRSLREVAARVDGLDPIVSLLDSLP